MPPDETRTLTAHLPTYRRARHFMRALDGIPRSLYARTHETIMNQRGSPQDQVTWTDPNSWIPERLNGDQQTLAMRIWRESKGELNPRHTRGAWSLTRHHDLLAEDDQGILRITERGQRFLAEPEGQVIAEIDLYEGILAILALISKRDQSRRSDIMPTYAAFCQNQTNYRSDNVIKSSLGDRLRNLLGRDYIERRGQGYSITDDGLAYLDAYAGLLSPRQPDDKQAQLRRAAKAITQEAREQLAAYLAEMDPFKFEELVQLLLEEMGYTDVETTTPVNDKGVDVVGDIELGISSVREVIQVKRHKGNISRPVLDGLRGSLHRFDAMRGTIITTGGFSQGTKKAAFERGAAPITLIDGETLLDLLITHGIGVRETVIEYTEFDPETLAQFEVEDQDAEDAL